jgi:hypothetical protein
VGRLEEVCRVSLKNNYRFSCSLMNLPLLYFLAWWTREEQRSPKHLVEIALSSYCQFLEEEFGRVADHMYLPMDELRLRGTLAAEKKGTLLKVRRQVTMFEGLFKHR